jgi:hypothetical protein
MILTRITLRGEGLSPNKPIKTLGGEGMDRTVVVENEVQWNTGLQRSPVQLTDWVTARTVDAVLIGVASSPSRRDAY